MILQFLMERNRTQSTFLTLKKTAYRNNVQNQRVRDYMLLNFHVE